MQRFAEFTKRMQKYAKICKFCTNLQKYAKILVLDPPCDRGDRETGNREAAPISTNDPSLPGLPRPLPPTSERGPAEPGTPK